MAKGRPKTPAEIRKLQGNPGRRPIPIPPKAAPVAETFPPPEWMDAGAKSEWRRVVKVYSGIKLITETDIPLLISWCTAVSEFVTVLKAIRKLEMKKEVDYKLLRINMISIRELRADLLALSARFGFSPVDRMKLALPPEKPKDENDIENFLNRNRKKA